MEETMKKIIVLLLMILLVVFTGFSETVKKEFKTEQGKRLKVNLKAGGDITITGWDKNLVTVSYEKPDLDQWDVRIKERDSGIEIESYSRKKKSHSSPDFEIRVPARYDLKVETMGGKIAIDNVNGDMKGTTMGGMLDLKDLKGHIDMKTMGGEIVLKNSDLDGKLKTMGGRVLFEDVTGDVNGSSMGGNVIYKNVKNRSGKSTGKMVKISTMGGAINVSDAPEGADVHTMGGSIHIKSAGKFVKAKTMGGDITVDAIDGAIKATTMGGDVEVTMTGNPGKGDRDVKLSSMGGEMTLTVPAALSMDVDIELAYTKNAKKKYKIISDFDLKIKETDTWDDSHGSPRKYIYGKAKIAGGKHKIKIKTINGNIYLKKGK
jgi:hypothetical protein